MQAIDCCDSALKIDDRNLKGLFRRATAYEALSQWELALQDLQLAKEIDTSNDVTIASAEARIKKHAWKGRRLCTDLQMEDLHHRFIAARGAEPTLAAAMLEGLHKQMRENDILALNSGAEFMANVLNIDLKEYLEDPSKMSMKELKEAVKQAGLEAQAVGFCERREYVSLLSSQKQNKKPMKQMSEEEIMETMLDQEGKKALNYEKQGMFQKAKKSMEAILFNLERFAGFDNWKTIESASAYARILRKFGDMEGAIFTASQICRQRAKLLGTSHPLFIESKDSLQKFLQDAGTEGSAEEFFGRVPADTVRSYLPFARKYTPAQLKEWADDVLAKAPNGSKVDLENYELAMLVIRDNDVVNYIMLGRQLKTALGISYEDD